MKDLSIIIPVYNDRENILPVSRAINEALKNVPFTYEIIFVDDGSVDNPQEIFETHNLKYISHSQNRGYGAAIKSGVKDAKSEYVCIMDCDCTYPPSDIPELMKYVKDYPMVVGARDVRINPWLHKVSKRIVNFLLSSLFHRDVTDINSGLRIIKTNLFKELLPGIGDKFSLTSSLTYGLLLMNLPIKYVPIQYNKRKGTSKVKRFSFTKNFIQSIFRMRRFCLKDKEIFSEGSSKKSLVAVDSPLFLGQQSINKKIETKTLWFVFLFGIIMATIFTGSQLITQYKVEYDVTQHSYWMVKYHNPELFRNDIYVKYAQYLSPPGYQFLYYMLTYLMDPIFAGKLLCIFLFGLTGIFCYLLGRHYWSELFGLLMVFFFIGHPQFLDRFMGGLQRSFSFPFLFMFIYFLSIQKKNLYGWLIGLQILFYPVTALISLAILIVNMILDSSSRKEFFKGKGVIWGYVFLIVSFALLAAQRIIQKPDFLGGMVSKSEIYNDPVFYAGGRSTYLPFNSLYEFIKDILMGNRGFYRILTPFSLLFFIFTWIKGKSTKHIWIPMLSVFLTSVVLFELAKLVLLKLYIPNRYLEYTFVILSTILLSMVVFVILMLIRNYKTQKIVLIMFIVISIICNVGAMKKFLRKKYEAYTDDVKMLMYLSTTPTDSVIAAEPFVSDDISVFSKRKVFLKYELSHPWFKNYRKIVEDRAEAFYRAYFTDSLLDLKRFAEKYGINYIICEKKVFTKVGWEEKKLIYQPLNNNLKLKYPFSSEKQYILPRIDKSLRCYEDNMYIVIRCDPVSIEKIIVASQSTDK